MLNVFRFRSDLAPSFLKSRGNQMGGRTCYASNFHETPKISTQEVTRKRLISSANISPPHVLLRPPGGTQTQEARTSKRR